MIKIDCFHCQRDGTETKFVARRIHEIHRSIHARLVCTSGMIPFLSTDLRRISLFL